MVLNYSISAATTASDVKPELLRLMRANFQWGHEADVWYQWGYEQSPFQPNVCWLAETPTRERVGFTTLMPRRMKVGVEVRAAGQAANLNVNSEHRSGLAAIKLQRALVQHLDQSDLAFAFGITRNAGPVLTRAGYRMVGNFSRWIKFFQTEYKVRRRIPWALPCRAVSAVLDLGLRLQSRETYARLPKGWQVLLDSPFDERFDALWQVASSHFSVTTERTSEYLNWRFRHDPQLEYRTLAVQDSEGRVRGVAIFLFPEPGELPQLGGIVDLLPADAQGLDALLAALCRHLRREGAIGVQMMYFGSPLIEAALQRFKFFRRDSDFQLLAYVHPRLRDQQTELLNPTGWHLTDAEAKF